MPKYLVRGSLSLDPVKGTLKEGGTKRREAVSKAAESVGAKIESIYYAFGEDDVFAIVDAPDNVSAAAVSMSVTAPGLAGSTQWYRSLSRLECSQPRSDPSACATN